MLRHKSICKYLLYKSVVAGAAFESVLDVAEEYAVVSCLLAVHPQIIIGQNILDGNLFSYKLEKAFGYLVH